MKIFKKIVALMAAATLAVSAVAVSASATSIEDTAVSMKLGDEVTCEFDGKSGEQYDYKVTVKEKGTLSVKVNTDSKYCTVYLFDEDCANVSIQSTEIKSGQIYCDQGKVGDPFAVYYYNAASGKTVATTTWNVTKGTYYIRVDNTRDTREGWRYDQTASKMKVTASFAKDNAKVFSYLGITMKKGSTMQLEAVDADKDDTSWSSSKKAIVTVSDTGKLTAKKKGTAIITCESGDTVVKLKITVK